MRLFLLLLLFLLLSAARAGAAVLDGFETVAPWRAAPADGVALALSSTEGWKGKALRLDFDFQGGAATPWRAGSWTSACRKTRRSPSGCAARRLPTTWSSSSSTLRGRTSGGCTARLRDPRGMAEVRIKKRHLQFAWGPIGGGEMKHAAALELAVTAGQGGKGWVAFDELTFEALPPGRPYDRTPQASSSPDGVSLDFLEDREYGGLVIDWGAGPHASRYEVQTLGRRRRLDDGARRRGEQRRQGLSLPPGDRVAPPASAASWRVRGTPRIDVKPLAFSASPNDFFTAIAKDAPRGAYPRYLAGERAYWTVVGADGDTEEALLSEDGALEPGKRRGRSSRSSGWTVRWSAGATSRRCRPSRRATCRSPP